jgi:hypothetical protein
MSTGARNPDFYSQPRPRLEPSVCSPSADEREIALFGSTVVIDTKKQFQPEGMLRVRIAHKGVGQAGQSEERLLKEIKEGLGELGLKQR